MVWPAGKGFGLNTTIQLVWESGGFRAHSESSEALSAEANPRISPCGLPVWKKTPSRFPSCPHCQQAVVRTRFSHRTRPRAITATPVPGPRAPTGDASMPGCSALKCSLPPAPSYPLHNGGALHLARIPSAAGEGHQVEASEAKGFPRSRN